MRSRGDARDGIELADPRATARKVRMRRLKRRIKATVALVIAAAAGTFIACSGDDKHARPAVPPNPTTDEVSNLPAPPASRDAGADAASPDAMALVPSDGRRDGGVDRTEHRKGMPVPDNLLE